MLSILIDTKYNSRAFYWLGKIEPTVCDAWLTKHKLNVPKDLKEFLENTGGGTAFESEEFLCPLNVPDFELDFIITNEKYYLKGLSRDYIIFQSGIFLSAIRISDHKYVLLDKTSYKDIQEFISFDEWYKNTIRKEFAERYDLPF